MVFPIPIAGNYLYAETKRGSTVYPALCKVNSSGDVVKTLADVSGARTHGDDIAVVKYSGDTFSVVNVFCALSGCTYVTRAV